MSARASAVCSTRYFCDCNIDTNYELLNQDLEKEVIVINLFIHVLFYGLRNNYCTLRYGCAIGNITSDHQ